MNEDTNEVLLRVVRNRLRKQSLFQAFVDFLRTWQEGGFRFSEILIVIAEWATLKSLKEASEREQWCAIALLLEEAAAIAETRGKELS